ncbi:13051_t:CDS:2 [Gigaspora margarita]|uniref:Stromal cell-derived factor 2-like protein n=2 Tax=Gigaspora margarita TaxID=4874 RepID=A0A8H3XKS4_GIGMA|nr:stromal cell-derived factor 2-like protein [Gigaspora margarita]CAG8799228.1 13051_t:CDS:2 [Gigaspora margarita]
MKIRARLIYALVISVVVVTFTQSQVLEIDEEFETVTCGSALKLTHSPSGYKLHSHSISYGTGSGQQSVTGLPNSDDPDSLWIVKGSIGKNCLRGEKIKCGDSIRLQHAGTEKFLHSHYHRSPLSNQQEVSAFDGLDSGDNWKLVCINTSSSYWFREQKVRLMHVETSSYLSANSEMVYNNPIHGQIEVAASSSNDKNTEWIAQEGIYFAERINS